MTVWIGSCSTRSSRWGISRRVTHVVAAAARRQRRRTGQHPSDADGRTVHLSGQGLGRSQRGPGRSSARPASASTASPRNSWPLTRSVPECFGARRQGPAPMWKVKRSAAGRIVNIERRTEYVNHYWFHTHRPGVGACDHQDVGAAAVRRTDHPQRTRVRGPAKPRRRG